MFLSAFNEISYGVDLLHVRASWKTFKRMQISIMSFPFTQDRIQMGSDPFGSDPLFERRLHGFGSRTVRVYTGSDPFGFYGFSAAF